jgi:ABC-type Na+ efflux pump permease subunit
MPYLLGTAAFVALIGLAGTPLVEDRQAFFASLDEVNLFSDGRVIVPVTLDGVPLDADPDLLPFTKVELDYDIDTLSGLTIETDRTILVSDSADPESMTMTPVRINPDEPVQYERGDLEAPPLPLDSDRVHLQNREIDPAVVRFTFETRPRVAEASTVPVTAIGFFLLISAYITFRQAAPRVAAIALATAKSEMAQPLYLVLLALGAVAILLFMIMPFHTLGDDIKLFKDSGITLIMVLGIIQAVWSAGTSVSEEIEGRTALTVLSKPVSRRGFLLGKYTGIMLGILVLFVLLAAVLVMATSYKPIFEARENSTTQPEWEVSHAQIVTTVPPLILYFMETMAIGSIAVALATRLPLLANGVICFVIYVVGNLTAPLVRSSAGDNALVGFVGNLIAVVVPNLNTFNVQSALDSGTLIPPIYLAGAFNYLVCFGIMIFMLALLLFEDRDLA